MTGEPMHADDRRRMLERAMAIMAALDADIAELRDWAERRRAMPPDRRQSTATSDRIVYDTLAIYPEFLATELATAGRTILDIGAEAGATFGDHASLAYFDPAAELQRDARWAADVLLGLGQTIVNTAAHPIDFARGLGRSTVDYLDRLTSDPTVSGKLLGDGAVSWAMLGGGGYAKQIGGAALSAFNKVPDLPKVPNSNLLDVLNPDFTPNAETLNKVTAFDFYTGEAGYSANDALLHMRGIDFTRPVTPVTIPYGSTAQQYVGPNGVGRYFSSIETTPLEVGITPEGRIPTLFQSMGDVKALESFTRPDYVWPTGTVPGAGRALQYFVPNNGMLVPISR